MNTIEKYVDYIMSICLSYKMKDIDKEVFYHCLNIANTEIQTLKESNENNT